MNQQTESAKNLLISSGYNPSEILIDRNGRLDTALNFFLGGKFDGLERMGQSKADEDQLNSLLLERALNAVKK